MSSASDALDATWYWAQDGATNGPVPRAEVEAAVARGDLRTDGLVWGPGLPEWVPPAQVPWLEEALEVALEAVSDAGSPSMPPRLPPSSLSSPGPSLAQRAEGVGTWLARFDDSDLLPHLRLLGRGLDRLERFAERERLDRFDRVARVAGNLLYPVAAGALIVAFLALAVELDSLKLFYRPVLGILVAASVLHFVAVLFLRACASLVATSPSRISSVAFLRSTSLLSVLFALACLVFGGQLLVDGEWVMACAGLGGFVLWLYVALVALCPEALGLKVRERASSGREALGILSVVAKLSLRVAPVLFGVAATIAAVEAIGFVALALDDESVPAVWTLGASLEMAWGVLGVALLPCVAYLVGIVVHLLVEVYQAVLDVPAILASPAAGSQPAGDFTLSAPLPGGERSR